MLRVVARRADGHGRAGRLGRGRARLRFCQRRQNNDAGGICRCVHARSEGSRSLLHPGKSGTGRGGRAGGGLGLTGKQISIRPLHREKRERENSHLDIVAGKRTAPEIKATFWGVCNSLRKSRLITRGSCLPPTDLFLLALGIPIIGPLLHFVFFVAVSFLNNPSKLFVAARALEKIVIGQLSPFILELSLKLVPTAFEFICVH